MAELASELEAVRDLLDAKVGQAFALATRTKARDVHSLSLSALGRCTRQAAYKLTRTPPSDPPTGAEESRAAMLGTWQHRGLLPKLRLLLRGARSEMKVILAAAGLQLSGQADLYWRRAGGGVLDVKTTREYGLSYIRQFGPRPEHRAQLEGYALACIQQGKPVAWIAYVYLDRATGEHETFIEAFTAERAMAVLDRVAEIVAAARNLRMAPRAEKGPGLSVVCDGCAWLRACWGPSARPKEVGAQGEATFRAGRVNAEAARSAAELYAGARAKGTEAEADKTFARALLASLPDGTYGRWRLSWGKPSKPKPDAKAMEARLRALGEPIPMAGGGTRTINLDPVPLDGDPPPFTKQTAQQRPVGL
jgi:hypothetical protein